MSSGYKERKRQEYRKQLEDAYASYERREPLSMDKLLEVVREFARRKLYRVESNPEFGQLGTIGTVDDYVQKVCEAVWKGLTQGSFRGNASTFYSWVHKIAFNQRRGFEGEILEQKYVKVPLLVSRAVGEDEKVTNDRDEYEQVDNPEIHDGPTAFDIGCTIPKDTQGVDLTICKLLLTDVQDKVNGRYIRRGRNYAEVARLLDMTTEAVEIRIRRMRERNIANKAQEKAEAKRRRQEAEEERRNSVSIGLAKLREAKL